MSISDWSSDVCSSDLVEVEHALFHRAVVLRLPVHLPLRADAAYAFAVTVATIDELEVRCGGVAGRPPPLARERLPPRALVDHQPRRSPPVVVAPVALAIGHPALAHGIGASLGAIQSPALATAEPDHPEETGKRSCRENMW